MLGAFHVLWRCLTVPQFFPLLELELSMVLITVRV